MGIILIRQRMIVIQGLYRTAMFALPSLVIIFLFRLPSFIYKLDLLSCFSETAWQCENFFNPSVP